MTDIIKIANIENYQQEIVDGTLILTPKKTHITEAELNSIGFENSIRTYDAIDSLFKLEGIDVVFISKAPETPESPEAPEAPGIINIIGIFTR